MCFIASILKPVYLEALIYSWSLGFLIEQCPHSAMRLVGLPPSAHLLQESSVLHSRAATMLCILEGRKTDRQRGLLLLACVRP